MNAGVVERFGLWLLFWLFVLPPCTPYLLYHFSRQRARIDKLLQTPQSLDLGEEYMRTRHKQDFRAWSNAPLISYGIGLIPYRELWNRISKKTAAALGNTQAAEIPEK